MSTEDTFRQLAGLDKLLHEPARLALMTALMACDSADFLYLQRLTGLTSGNLSVQLSRLEEAGMLASEKKFVDKRPNTMLSLTPLGRESIEAYWKKMDQLKKYADDFQSRDGQL